MHMNHQWNALQYVRGCISKSISKHLFRKITKWKVQQWTIPRVGVGRPMNTVVHDLWRTMNINMNHQWNNSGYQRVTICPKYIIFGQFVTRCWNQCLILQFQSCADKIRKMQKWKVQQWVIPRVGVKRVMFLMFINQLRTPSMHMNSQWNTIENLRGCICKNCK